MAAAVPPLVELVRVGSSAGTAVPALIRAVAPRSPQALRTRIHDAVRELDRGRPVAAVLADLGDDLGPDGALLCDALRRSVATGSPLGPALDEVATTVADRRRRRAQEAARRLPVTLLAPLVLCTLPAALVLSVGPVLVVSLRSLSP